MFVGIKVSINKDHKTFAKSKLTIYKEMIIIRSSLFTYENYIKVPGLPDQPPNFLVAAEIREHVTPVAVVPEQPVEDPEPDTAESLIPMADEKDR